MTPAITRADVRLLALVARLPFASTRHLAVLSGEPASAGVYRCAARLMERGLLAWVAGPSTSGVGRSPRLLYPTELGLRLLASAAGVDPVVLARELGLRRPALPRRLAGLPAFAGQLRVASSPGDCWFWRRQLACLGAALAPYLSTSAAPPPSGGSRSGLDRTHVDTPSDRASGLRALPVNSRHRRPVDPDLSSAAWPPG